MMGSVRQRNDADKKMGQQKPRLESSFSPHAHTAGHSHATGMVMLKKKKVGFS